MCVRIGKPNQPVDVAALRVNYVGFELLEEQAHGDPIQQVCCTCLLFVVSLASSGISSFFVDKLAEFCSQKDFAPF
jgi:hypothetical protein